MTIRIEHGDTQCRTGKREKTVDNCFFEVCHRSKEKRSEAAPSARFDYASGRKEGTPQSNACLQGGGKPLRPEGVRHQIKQTAYFLSAFHIWGQKLIKKAAFLRFYCVLGYHWQPIKSIDIVTILWHNVFGSLEMILKDIMRDDVMEAFQTTSFSDILTLE